MAQRTLYADDITGEPIEDEDFKPTKLIIDGQGYEIDLGEDSKAALMKSLRKYLKNARKVAAPAARTGVRAQQAENKKIREWAEENDIELTERGRIPDMVKVAYRKNDPSIYLKSIEEDDDEEFELDLEDDNE